MTEPTQPAFYSPWPLFGQKLSNQWHESRWNSEVLAVLAQAAGIDVDADALNQSDLMSWELGQHDFHNRFRLVYDDAGTAFKIQKNAGTEGTPVWVNALTIDYETLDVTFSGAVGGSFYLDVKTTTGPVFSTDLLIFDREDFYISPNSAGKPVVSLAAEDGGGSGGISSITVKSTVVPPTFSTDTITFDRDDFYISSDSLGKPVISLDEETVASLSSITVQTTVPLPTFSTNTILFDRSDFYISPSSTGVPIVSLASEDVDTNTTALVVKTTNALPTFTTDTLTFDRANFYISPDSTGKPVVSWTPSSSSSGGDPTVVSGVQSQTFPSSVEWIFNHNLNSRPLLWSTYSTNFEAVLPDKLDISDANTAYFYFVEAFAGTAIVSSGRTSVDLTGGFYGISVRNNPRTESFKNINLLSFDSTDFYLTQNAGNTDEVLVSLRESIGNFVHKSGDQMTGTLLVGTKTTPVQIKQGTYGVNPFGVFNPPYSFSSSYFQGDTAGMGYYENFFDLIPHLFFTSAGKDVLTLTNNSLFIPNSPYLNLTSFFGSTGIFGAKYIQLAAITTVQRDTATFLTPTNGMLIHNTTTGTIQARLAGAWVNL